MFTKTINLSAGESVNVGGEIPYATNDANVVITSGRAILNGTESNFISWVNPNPSIIITAITDCVVELSDKETEIIPVEPLP